MTCSAESGCLPLLPGVSGRYRRVPGLPRRRSRRRRSAPVDITAHSYRSATFGAALSFYLGAAPFFLEVIPPGTTCSRPDPTHRHRPHAIGARSNDRRRARSPANNGRLPKIRTPGAQTGRCARRRATITTAPV